MVRSPDAALTGPPLMGQSTKWTPSFSNAAAALRAHVAYERYTERVYVRQTEQEHLDESNF
jgi:hypothetical protein